MMDNLNAQIRNNLNLKDTDELLDIWQNNNREEWSDATFSAILEILNGRGVEIPAQDGFLPNQGGDEADGKEFTEREIKILDDENPPAFYDPFEVLKISDWIEKAAKIMIGFIVISTLTGFSFTKNLIQSYFVGHSMPVLTNLITLLVLLSSGAITIIITYFPLLALSRILKILMDMEFDSRVALQPAELPLRED